MNRLMRFAGVILLLSFVVSSQSCSNGDSFAQGRYKLSRVFNCDELRENLAVMATEMLLGHHYRFMDGLGGMTEMQDSNAGPIGLDNAAPEDFTTTNNQEEGVDEADIVETDGEYIYVLNNQDLVIALSWPAAETAEVGRVEIGGDPQSMFLYQNRVAVFSYIWDETPQYISADNAGCWPGKSYTRITLIDISDRYNPEIMRQVDLEGWMIDARAIEGQVYLALNSQPNLYKEGIYELLEGIDLEWWNAFIPELARQQAKQKLLPIVRKFLSEFSLEELMPSKIEGGVKSALLNCSDLYKTPQSTKTGLVVIAAFDMTDDQQDVTTTGVIGGGMELYASKQNIYLAQRSWDWIVSQDNEEVITHIHKLQLNPNGEAPTYQASGVVPGWLLNQFSMSENDDRIRLATTDNTWWDQDRGNNIFVMQQEGDELVIVGKLRNLSPGERIYSARFFPERAYLVTFMQIDPLHCIDLSDPTNPVELGELEVPGFSTYLHPAGEGFLLAIGNDGDWNVQLSFFDVRDPANPVRMHAHSIAVGNWGSYSEAMYDHHAFTYHPDKKILSIPVNIYTHGNYFTGAMVFRVTPEDGFQPLGKVDHSEIAIAAGCPHWLTNQQELCYEEYKWWTNMRRSIFIEDFLYTISSVGMSVDELLNPENHIASVVF